MATSALDECLSAIERATAEEALAEALSYITTIGSVNDVGSFGYTILIRACEKSHLEVVELCFQHQVDYNHQTIHKETAFNSASRHGNVSVLRLLVQLSRSVVAAVASTTTALDLDIRSRNKDGCTPFHQAVQSGDVDKVQYMASELDVDQEEPDDQGLTPLHSAVRRGDIRMVAYLHDLGCNINSATSRGVSPLFSAVSHKMYNKGVTHENNLELTKLLLSYGASSSVRTNNGWTLLSGAVEREDIPLAHFILALPDCDVNEPAQDGRTPLFRAVEKGNFPLVQLLVRHGADFNLNNSVQHISPLLKACDKGDTKMAEYLVHLGAVMPQQLGRIRNSTLRAKLQLVAENRKYFPIHSFLRRNDNQHEKLLETIQSFSDDVCRIDGNGQTPYMIAKEMYETAKTEELRAALIHILIQVCRIVVRTFAGSTCQSLVSNSMFVKPSSTLSFPSFRYTNGGIGDIAGGSNGSGQIEVFYFEVTLLTEGLVQIGVTAPEWTPRSSNDGVGDDNQSVAFDGKRKCCFVFGQQVALEANVVDAMPIWQPGAVVGVAVTEGGRGQRWVTFFLNNMRVSKAISLAPMFSVAAYEDAAVDTVNGHEKKDVFCCTATCTLSRGSAVRCNFGETAFSYVPIVDDAPDTVSKVIPWHVVRAGQTNSKSNRKKCGVVQYYQFANQKSARWTLLDNHRSDEFAVESSQDMFDCVAKDSFAELLDSVLSTAAAMQAVDMNVLCTQIKDPFGRTLMDLASVSCRRVLQTHLFFLKRFEILTPNKPEHISDTCMVMLCRDHFTDEGEDEENGADAKKLVALKIMKNKSEFQKEVFNRVNSKLDDSYVIGVLDYFDGEVDVNVATELKEKGFANYGFCIVMPAAERTLERILAQENVAGKEWSQIKYMFTQLVECVSHMHSQNLLHADLKPLNIMRTALGNMLLIDLDASVNLRSGGGGTLPLDQKYSSAFCPPEWAAAELQRQTTTFTGSTLRAHSSFDLWSLGAVLFHMVSGEPLFLSNQADSIDAVNLQTLSEWSDNYKQSKLEKIIDTEAQNLVSRLLSKDPAMRPSLSAVLLHPFLSGRPATRLVGSPADFDVFISYRVASDSKHAEILYDNLTALGLRVWFDKKCLLPGKNWEEGFCDGLVKSRAFVCLLSKGAIAHPTNTRQNLSQLSVTSGCDNVLLEHQLALEMRAMGMLDYVFPVFIGEADTATGGGLAVYKAFDFSALGNLPTYSIPSVDKKLRGHLDRQCLGAPLSPGRSVKDTLDTVTSFQGGFISGEGNKAFDAVAKSVHDMCHLGTSVSSPPPPSQGVTQAMHELHLKIQDMLTQNKSAVEIDASICDFIRRLNII